MIYKCEDINLAASLLTFKDFTFDGLVEDGETKKMCVGIGYKSKRNLIEKLELHLNKSLTVNFEKYKSNLNMLGRRI